MSFVCCREQLNLAVLSLKESDDLAGLTNKWWYDRGECGTADKQVSCLIALLLVFIVPDCVFVFLTGNNPE